jgi:CubicO group peptidase (beta-lactamase class C family)
VSRGILSLVCAGIAACAPGRPEPVAPAKFPGWADVSRYLDSVIADGVAPGAVLGVSFRGCHSYHASGRLGLEDATRPDSSTVYDLASLTKVVGLTTVAMLAVERGAIALDTPVTRYLAAFHDSTVTIRHLLTHSSGLPAWRPLHLETPSRDAAFALLDTMGLGATPGDRFAYSDLGAVLLTQLLEGRLGRRLDRLVEGMLTRPLGLRDTRYLPPRGWRARIAPTENDPWRGRMLRGEVHDENAARLDGVSGHAGLFGSARDLLRFGDWLLSGVGDPVEGPGCEPRGLPGPPRLIGEFIQRQDLPPGSSRALGWDTPSGMSSAGTILDPSSFGHTGFTGTSIWIDPTRRLVIVLLANRVHPTRDNPRFGPVRGQMADRVARALGFDRLTR